MPIISSSVFSTSVTASTIRRTSKHDTAAARLRQILTAAFWQAALVKAWALLHQDELCANRELAMMDAKLCKIDPLK